MPSAPENPWVVIADYNEAPAIANVVADVIGAGYRTVRKRCFDPILRRTA